LTDKALTKDGNKVIAKSEFDNLCKNYFIVDSDKNMWRNNHLDYLSALYEYSKDSDDAENVNIYWILLFLVPILENEMKERVKGFYRCMLFLENERQFMGNTLKNYFIELVHWNTRLGAGAIVKGAALTEDEKTSINGLIDKVYSYDNVVNLATVVSNLIAPTDKDLEGRLIVINDLYTISTTQGFPFVLAELTREAWDRFAPKEEK